MSNSYGFEVNAAATVGEDGNCSLGVHFKDSEGFDVNKSADGKSFGDVINKVCDAMHKELTESRDKKADEKRQRREELQSQIDELQKQIDALEAPKEVEEKAKEESSNLRESFDKLYGGLIHDFFSW